MLLVHCLSVLSVCLSVTLVYCGQMAVWIKMKVRIELGLALSHIVLHGDPAAQRDTAAQFLAHVCCGQMAGWMKMPLGTKVGLSPGHIVLDGGPAPLPQKGLQFSAHVYCGQTGHPSQLLLSTF